MKTISIGDPQSTSTPHKYRIDLPPSVGQGGIDINSFACGLQLMTANIQTKQPALFHSILEKPYIGFGFCLAGQFDYHPVCFDKPFTIKAEDSAFFSFPKAVEAIETSNSSQMIRICLMIEENFLFDLSHEDEDRFSPMLKIIEKKSPCRVVNTITPVMKALLHQMLNCPYRGITRHIFLEGKAMELLAHKLEQLHPNHAHHDYSLTIKSSDAERAHQAAHMLTHDLENPPDIMTLSRSVGLNRNKLYRCFRQVFGMSPFEFLRNQRLHTAMLMLQEGKVNVTEAALMVGYNNLSYFAKAFKSMFGIAPGALCKSFSVTHTRLKL